MSTSLIPFRVRREGSGEGAEPRTLVHLDLDCFFVSVERVLNPTLAQRPVIVGGAADSRGVVCSASREARAFGVRAGMPTAAAARLCPEAAFLPGRGRLYARAAASAMRVLREFVPDVERASIDEAYLEVTDVLTSWPSAIDLGAALQDALLERLGLPSSVGIASNKLVAKVACGRAKPEGLLEVWPGYEEAFLAVLPIEELPGVGPVMAARLRLFGLQTCGDLARVSPALLEATFGASGRNLAAKARGIGDDRLAGDGEPRSLSRERTFPVDVCSSARLIDEIYRLSADVADRLRRQGLRARGVTLKVRAADFRTSTRSRSLRLPTDSGSELAGIACFLLQELGDIGPVRLLGLGASDLSHDPVQPSLFEERPPPVIVPRKDARPARVEESASAEAPW